MMLSDAFAFSRDVFSGEAEKIIYTRGFDGSTVIKLSLNENPHGPSPATKKATRVLFILIRAHPGKR